MGTTTRAVGQSKVPQLDLFPNVPRAGAGEVAKAWSMRFGSLLSETDGRIESERIEGSNGDSKGLEETYD